MSLTRALVASRNLLLDEVASSRRHLVGLDRLSTVVSLRVPGPRAKLTVPRVPPPVMCVAAGSGPAGEAGPSRRHHAAPHRGPVNCHSHGPGNLYVTEE